MLLWSTGFIGAKFGLPYAEPLTFLSSRYAGDHSDEPARALAMRAPWPACPREALHIGVTGVLVPRCTSAACSCRSTAAAGRHLGAGGGMQPLLTAALAGALLGERYRRQWAGLALGFGGVALVVGSKANVDGVDGGALDPCSSPRWRRCSASPPARCTRTLLPALRPPYRLGDAVPAQSGPHLLVASQTETMQIRWTGDFVFALGWLVLVLSIGAISLLNLLIRSGSAVNVASLFYLTPPTTALIAWAMFDEKLSALAIAGMAIAVSGVWLARKG